MSTAAVMHNYVYYSVLHWHRSGPPCPPCWVNNRVPAECPAIIGQIRDFSLLHISHSCAWSKVSCAAAVGSIALVWPFYLLVPDKVCSCPAGAALLQMSCVCCGRAPRVCSREL